MPVSTAGVLQAALREELQQLEPQLLPLFGTGRERLPAPTARTHAALKMLVALTRFFPVEHRIRKAGKQLELLWPPLVHEPRGVVAGKLLHYYYRVRHELLDPPRTALRQALQELVQGAIDQAQVSGNAARGADCVQKLRHLAPLLPELAACAPLALRMTPLAQLCLWQQQLELAAAGDCPDRTAAQQLLTPWLQELRDRCAELCAASDWSLAYYCQSGLARMLWQLRSLMRFAGAADTADRLDALDERCLDLHLAATAPDADAVHGWLVRLFGLERDAAPGSGENLQQHASGAETGSPRAEPAPDPELHALYNQELARYQILLQDTLAHGAPLPVTAPLITLLYKVTWVFDAAGYKDQARLCHCAYRVALQCWRIKRPLPRDCHAVLGSLAPDLGGELAVSTLRHWRQRLLREWPGGTGDGKRPIALRADARQAIPLAAVPQLLSASFATLVRVPAEHFAPPPAEDLCRQTLQELMLLESGAAAMKVWPLEQLCTLLIAVYEAHLRDRAPLPATLLQDAHRQLVRMLDQSAAWQEAQCEGQLLQGLEAWLAGQSACREPPPGAEPQASDSSARLLREHLLGCLGTLATVLERPVRLQLETGGATLDEARLALVLDCLRPLVKFMLLDRAVDTRGRHAMHKPRISTLTVTLRATSSTLIVSAAEDSHDDTLPPAEVQQLQRRLPRAAGPLVCESRAGLGRCFTFTLL